MEENDVQIVNKRLVWLDWMKTLAMYCIIAGHIHVPGNKYIYVFSVPCFFIISGFLCKREQDLKFFWIKIWWNLVVPMFLLFFVNKLIDSAMKIADGSFQMCFLWQMPLNGLLGFHGKDFPAGGLGVLWFVYTLVICKVILQYVPARYEKLTLTIISLLMLIGVVALNESGITVYNAFANVLLAMPFFTIGYFMRPYKERIVSLKLRWMPLILIFGGLVVWLCGTYNDTVFLWKCSYGSNLFLCFIGACFGTTAVYAISRLVCAYLADLSQVIGGVR